MQTSIAAGCEGLHFALGRMLLEAEGKVYLEKHHSILSCFSPEEQLSISQQKGRPSV